MAKILRSVKVYILLGYITLIMIASVTVWVIYDETLELYDNQVDLNPVNNKIFLTNSILTSLYEAEGLERSYLQTGNPEHYKNYNVLIDSISSQIEMLGSIESNPSQLMHTDSIQKLLIKKRENLKELNAIKNSASSEKLYERALFRLTQNKDSLDHLFTIYTTINTSKDSIFSRQKKARFFERLINVFAPPTQPDSSLEVVVNKSIQVDSILNVFNPTDSVQQILTSIIEDIRKESGAFEKQLIQKEQENLENARTITLQIRQILSKLENEEILYSLRKVSVQQEHVSQMTNIVIVLGALALLVIIGFLTLILKDITRSQHYRQHLEKEKNYSESLLKSKEQLMLSITHDLKSPLHSIAGFANLAIREKSSTRQIQYLRNIEHSSNYISRLINDLLDFARLETGKMTIEKHSVNLKNLIEEAVSGFYPLAKEKNLKLELDAEKLADKIYLTDGARIHQILSNLISNAIKFTSKGHVKIKATLTKPKGKSDQVQIEVEDTGIGISNENSHLIFEEFTRISSDKNIQYEGTGLGLPITKRIVELLNGSIKFSSKLGEGSRFTVVLPMKRQSQKISSEVNSSLPKENGKKTVFNNERVLLVDDDPFILELTSHVLTDANLNVASYANVDEAMDAINKQNFDLLITDVQMPEKNGFELLSYFKRRNSDKVPAIAVTGEHTDQHHYLTAGFSAVLQKPFHPNEILEAVSNVLTFGSTNLSGIKKVVNSTSGQYSIEGIKAFAEGEMETTREILTSFAQSTSQNLQMFRLHIQAEDYEEIRKLAHKMLPMFRQLEAVDIIKPLEMMEQNKYNGKEDEWLKESYQLLINIEYLMGKIIEEYQLPFSGKLIS